MPSSLIARGLNEEVLNEKFAAKIAANEFNEKTYKQCIADELLKELFFFSYPNITTQVFVMGG